MNRSVAVAASVLFLAAACHKNQNGGASSASSVNAACASGTVDLSKVSGTWVANANIPQPEGSFRGDQYRIHFDGPPGADGKLKATLAFRMDSRTYTGTYTPTKLGGVIDLVEDMSDDTVAQLRKNQDPNQPMRSAVKLSPEESGCTLFASDETIIYVGDKDLRKPMLGPLKLVPAKADTQYSFLRCTEPRAVYFDGKAEDNGQPVRVAPGKNVKVTVTGPHKDQPDCPYSADIYLDGVLAQAKAPGKVATVDGVDAITWEGQITPLSGPPHGVEVHAYADCTDGRKLIAAACNNLITQ